MSAKPGRELTGHTGDNEKGTPRYLFDWLNRRYVFDYDAFASHDNHLLPLYSTKEGTFDTRGRDHSPGNAPALLHGPTGLTGSWEGLRTFCNPPYGTGIFMQCVRKMIAERNQAAIIVGLVKWDTSTEVARLLRHYADVTELPRVKYDGEQHAATFASAIVVLRADVPHR